MIKRPIKLRVRIEYEPNRFSSEHVISVYERLKPIDAYAASQEQEGKEASTVASVTEGAKA